VLEDLPRMQLHLFVPWNRTDMGKSICQFCGGPPQAHPTPEALEKIKREAKDDRP
jgi:hypothetical protein